MKKLTYLFITMLSACSTTLPKYVEPDPASTDTANLRVVVYAGVGAIISIHPNKEGRCLEYEGAEKLPIHTNTSGLFVEGDKKIGMPASDAYSKKIGNEMYIPASQFVTIGAEYWGSNGVHRAYCHNAFMFYAAKGKNYEIHFFAGVGGKEGAVCKSDLVIIPEGHSEGTRLQPQVTIPKLVKGSPLWDSACKSDESAGKKTATPAKR